jgi:hypothetical protein
MPPALRQRRAYRRRAAKAFSSEVDTGSREENASKQKLEPGDSNRTDKARTQNIPIK